LQPGHAAALHRRLARAGAAGLRRLLGGALPYLSRGAPGSPPPSPSPARRLRSIGRSPHPLPPTSRRAPRSGRLSDLRAPSRVAHRCDSRSRGGEDDKEVSPGHSHRGSIPWFPLSSRSRRLSHSSAGRARHVFDSRCSCPSCSTLVKPPHTATSRPAPSRSSASRAAGRTSSAWEAPSAISSRISTSGSSRAAGAPPPIHRPPPRPRRAARPPRRCPGGPPRLRLPHRPPAALPKDERAAHQRRGHRTVARRADGGARDRDTRGAPGAPERAPSCAPKRTLRIASACCDLGSDTPGAQRPCSGARSNHGRALRQAQRSRRSARTPRRSRGACACALALRMRLHACAAHALGGRSLRSTLMRSALVRLAMRMTSCASGADALDALPGATRAHARRSVAPARRLAPAQPARTDCGAWPQPKPHAGRSTARGERTWR
jgi:hypothetical protein